MSQQANATAIGAFTLSALLIAAAAVILFGAGKWFERSHDVVLYFEKSAHGLQVGSDARFGGVLIGRVKSISVLVDRRENRKIIPVVVQLGDRELRAISSASGATLDFTSREGVQAAVDEGLRGRMVQQSLLTGLLYVEFDIVPDSVGFVFEPAEAQSELPAIPTIGTEIDELISGVADGLKKFNELDIASILEDLQSTIVSVRNQVDAIKSDEISANIEAITEELKELVSNEHLANAIASLDEALAEIKLLAINAREGLEPVMADLDKTMESANSSLEKFEQTMASVGEMVNPRAPVLMRLQNVLLETERAARVIAELANDIQRNPNSLLFGREPEQ
jgi:paraquat-inducible protein B